MAGSAKLRRYRLPFWALGLIGAAVASGVLVYTHPAHATVSFDEGFHGGAALAYYQAFLHLLHRPIPGGNFRYLLGEYNTGLVLYPPLWMAVGALLATVLGPGTDTFRLGTTLFYFLTLFGAFWFTYLVSKSRLAALMALGILATVPLMIIYGHLMMLEVPQVWGISAMVGSFYLYATGLLRRSWRSFALLAVIFLVAPFTKLPAAPVAWAVIGAFVVLSSLCFWRSRYGRHFLKPELLVLPLLSFGALAAYTYLEKRYLHANLVQALFEQSEAMSGEKASPLRHLWLVMSTHYRFYLKEFQQFPVLATVWLGCLAGVLVRRRALGLLLAVWAAVTYLAFSAVTPQNNQYAMSLYVPLAIATALFLYDLSGLVRPLRLRVAALAGVTVCLMGVQVIAAASDETYGWRAYPRGIDQAAQYVADRAQPGDAVLSWHDGVTFELRSRGLQKELEIQNAVHQVCELAETDDFQWAVTVNEPPLISDTDRAILSAAPWQEVARFGQDHNTVVYRNPAATMPLTAEAEAMYPERAAADPTASGGSAVTLTQAGDQPTYWGCLRQYPVGALTANFSLKAVSVPADLPDSQGVLHLEYSSYPAGETFGRDVTAGELRKSAGWQDFSVAVDHRRISLPAELRIFVTAPVAVSVDRIRVSKQ